MRKIVKKSFRPEETTVFDDASAEETAVVNDATATEILVHAAEVEKVTALAIIATMRTIYEESAWHAAADDVALLMPLDGVKDLLEADDGTRTAAKACDEVWGCVSYAKSLCQDQLEPLKN